MPLASNAVMTFTRYEIEDDGIRMHFVCSAPGGGEPSDYSILVPDVDFQGANTNPQILAVVTAAMKRKYRAQNYATRLDNFIGQQLTI